MQVGAVLVLVDVSATTEPFVHAEIFSAGIVFFWSARDYARLLGEPILYRIVENLRKSEWDDFSCHRRRLASHVVVRD